MFKSQFMEQFGNEADRRPYCKYVDLGQLCKKGSSKLSMKNLEGDDGEYPVYGAAGYIKSINSYEMNEDYVAIIKDGAGVGRTYCYPKKTSIINTMQYLMPSPGVSVRFLESLVRCLDLGREYTGSTIPHIYFKDYSKKIVPWPEMEYQENFAKLSDQSDKSKYTASRLMRLKTI